MIKQKTYTYTVQGVDQEFEIRDIEKDLPFTVALKAARDYYHNHDGWENDWPLNITVKNGDKSWTFSVDCEAKPEFYVKRLEEGKQ